MSALVLMFTGLVVLFSGYIFYSKFVAGKVLQLEEEFVTPAHEMEDGVDYVPTNKYVLWGHHFTSVAGAAPIIGPAIAVIWGWAPAFLWVVFGSVFFAGVHDMSAVWASVRHKGQSMGKIAGMVISKRAQSLFMIVIFLLLLMVNAVFAVSIAGMLIKTPGAVLPVWGALVVAFLIGQAIYRFKWNLVIVSIVGVIALYALIFLGPKFPIVLPETVLGLPAHGMWVLLLFVYAAIASLLPVWMLLQPRDYINGLQLFIGLIALYVSVLLVNPTVVAPALNSNVPAGTPSIVPLLFVTIACGAISGFHGLVSAGTTSKQVDKETDIRFIGYFGAIGEGLLALVAILVTVAGFATLGEWEAVYSKFGAGGVAAFIDGGGSILNKGLGLNMEVSSTMLTVMAALFAGTTMDTGVRLQRYIFQEWGEIYNINAIKKNSVSTLLSVGTCMLISFGAGGLSGKGGMIIWPLFGTTNQLMAGLTLLIITVSLLKLKRKVWFTILPMVFLLIVATIALFLQLYSFFQAGNWLLVVLDLVILVASIFVSLESISTLKREWGKSSL